MSTAYTSKPTPSPEYAGKIIRVRAATGQRTYVYICVQNDANAWEWIQLGASTRQRDSVHQFIKTRIRPEPTGIITKDKLYQKYREYCKHNSYTLLTRQAFSKAILKRIPNITHTRRSIDGVRRHCWAGIMDKTDY